MPEPDYPPPATLMDAHVDRSRRGGMSGPPLPATRSSNTSPSEPNPSMKGGDSGSVSGRIDLSAVFRLDPSPPSEENGSRKKGMHPLLFPGHRPLARGTRNLDRETKRYGKNQGQRIQDRKKGGPVISRRLLSRIGGLIEGGSEERLRSRSRLLTLPASPRILVVCHGNLCRSPAAEQFLKRRLSSRRFEVSSGGLSHQENLPSPQDFVREARSFGLDLSGHRSRTVSPLLAEWADLILFMDRSNRDLLLDFGGGAVRKSAWLGAWDSGGSLEIPDPYGKTSAVMRQVLDRLSRASDALAKELSHRFPLPPDPA